MKKDGSPSMQCTICLHANEDGARTCSACGAPLGTSEDASVRSHGLDHSLSDRERTRAAQPRGTSLPPDRSRAVGFGGRYEVIGVLGRGGMGEVWLARDTRLDRRVAIKRILSDTSEASGLAARFEQEARSIAQLQHPNIVSLLDYDVDDHGPYLVLEYVFGDTLARHLASGPIPESESITIFRDLLDGMQHAHERNVLHRDLKPSNVILDERLRAHILDFGLARSGDEFELSMTGLGMGTLDYAAPEQKRDAKRVDERADVYSLGVMLYEMLTGLHPPPHLPKAPEAWRDLIARACDPIPDDRPANISALRELFESIARDRTQLAEPEGGEATESPSPTDVRRHTIERAIETLERAERRGGTFQQASLRRVRAMLSEEDADLSEEVDALEERWLRHERRHAAKRVRTVSILFAIGAACALAAFILSGSSRRPAKSPSVDRATPAPHRESGPGPERDREGEREAEKRLAEAAAQRAYDAARAVESGARRAPGPLDLTRAIEAFASVTRNHGGTEASLRAEDRRRELLAEQARLEQDRLDARERERKRLAALQAEEEHQRRERERLEEEERARERERLAEESRLARVRATEEAVAQLERALANEDPRAREYYRDLLSLASDHDRLRTAREDVARLPLPPGTMMPFESAPRFDLDDHIILPASHGFRVVTTKGEWSFRIDPASLRIAAGPQRLGIATPRRRIVSVSTRGAESEVVRLEDLRTPRGEDEFLRYLPENLIVVGQDVFRIPPGKPAGPFRYGSTSWPRNEWADGLFSLTNTAAANDVRVRALPGEGDRSYIFFITDRGPQHARVTCARAAHENLEGNYVDTLDVLASPGLPLPFEVVPRGRGTALLIVLTDRVPALLTFQDKRSHVRTKGPALDAGLALGAVSAIDALGDGTPEYVGLVRTPDDRWALRVLLEER